MSTRDGAVRVLRHSGELAAMAGSWLAAELPPHVLTAQAIAAMPIYRGPVDTFARGIAAQGSDVVLAEALRTGFGAQYASEVVHPRIPARAARPRGLATVLRYRHKYARGDADIAYGPGGAAHALDIWRRPDLPAASRAPVLVHIPGGAWSMNDKRGQGYALLAAMAERGWVGVSINYRRSPHHPWPAHAVDVKRALAWVKTHIGAFGGDPDFVAVTGGSAGGHLSALAALTANDPQWQPGFEDADTAVAAAVPMYGVFDLSDATHMHPKMMPFLERSVLQMPLADNYPAYELASPLFHVRGDAPPFFVLHGAKDSVVPPGQSQVFCAALRSAQASTVLHAELPHAHHMFDAVGSVRSHLVAEAAATFLGIVYGRHLAGNSVLTTRWGGENAGGTSSLG